MQKATLTFTDGEDGQLHISMEFEPEITDEATSGAVTCAVKCMEYITDTLMK